MGRIVNIYEEVNRYRYKVKMCTAIDGDRLYEVCMIVLEDNVTGQIINIPQFNKFFINNKMINKEKNTRFKYANAIKMFLNSIFFDRKFYKRSRSHISEINIKNNEKIENLDNIINLKLEDVNIFLADYKYGRAGAQGEKTKNSIIQLEISLIAFVYYLVRSIDYKMRFINISDFILDSKEELFYKNNKIVNNPFTILYPSSIKREKLEYISFYALSEFISLALENYPMITLAICLQAFAGLRKGEVPNVTWANIEWRYIGDELKSFRINLKNKKFQLRSDGKDVGQIKSHEVAHVHPALLFFFDLVFKEHRRYIIEDVRKRNRYDALFLNRDGKAMTERNYEYAFNELVDLLIYKLLNSGNSLARDEAETMIHTPFTTHTLRYFFSQYIAMLPDTNIFEIAMFRRDRSLGSALRYIRSNPYLIDKRIKKMQDKHKQTSEFY